MAVNADGLSPSSKEHDPFMFMTSKSSDSQGHIRLRKFEDGWIREDKWKLGNLIGSGSSAEVFQCMNDRGKLFAVKRQRLRDRQEELDKLINEIEVMKLLSHPNIVEYHGAKIDYVNECVYIFQEWVPGGSVAHLLNRFGPFSTSVIRCYLRQILWGLQYLHSQDVIHRDIKGGNILVDNKGDLKLADFGASARLELGETQDTGNINGTPYFMAPEVLASSKYGRKGDIWAVGCTIIQMLTGDPPWKDHKVHGLVKRRLRYFVSSLSLSVSSSRYTLILCLTMPCQCLCLCLRYSYIFYCHPGKDHRRIEMRLSHQLCKSVLSYAFLNHLKIVRLLPIF